VGGVIFMMNMQCDGLKLVQRETIRQTGSEGLFISKQSCVLGTRVILRYGSQRLEPMLKENPHSRSLEESRPGGFWASSR